jgi:uncharacterized protein (DUF1684 family)
MLLEAVQTVAAQLADPTHGVNALRTVVPLYPGDTAPPAVTVVQVFRDAEAARGQATQVGLPALEVGLWQDPAQETLPSVRPFPADGEVQVHVRYLAAKTVTTDVALRNTALTLRCAARSLAVLGVTGAIVNQVQLITVANVRTLAMYAPDGDAIVTGALVATVRVRDLWTHPT